jgi:hypothetical protein
MRLLDGSCFLVLSDLLYVVVPLDGATEGDIHPDYPVLPSKTGCYRAEKPQKNACVLCWRVLRAQSIYTACDVRPAASRGADLAEKVLKSAFLLLMAVL